MTDLSQAQLQAAAAQAGFQQLALAGMRATIAKDMLVALVSNVGTDEELPENEPLEVYERWATTAVALADALLRALAKPQRPAGSAGS